MANIRYRQDMKNDFLPIGIVADEKARWNRPIYLAKSKQMLFLLKSEVPFENAYQMGPIFYRP